MATKFKGEYLFGAGPSRIRIGPAGEYVLTNARVDPFLAGSQPVGPLEQTLTVTGRLVANDEESLAALLAAINAELTHPPRVGTVADPAGNEWNDMSFVRFEPTAPIQRARQISLPFIAEFIRFAPI